MPGNKCELKTFKNFDKISSGMIFTVDVLIFSSLWCVDNVIIDLVRP